MTILNTLIYDHTQKTAFDYPLAGLIFILFMVGMMLVKASRISNPAMLRPGKLTFIWLLLLRAHPRKNKIYGRTAIVASVIIAALYIHNYLLIKKPEWFNNLTHASGQIEKIEEKNTNKPARINIQINGETFYIAKDKGYIAKRAPVAGDSVTISYYSETNPRLTPQENKKVVKLEVVK